MNRIKKSQAKYLVFFLTGFLIFILGILLHPTTRSLFPHYRTNLYNELIMDISSPRSEVSMVQDFWKFREFYSRGEITLAKHSEVTIPEQISSVMTVTEGFTPYLDFHSDKIVSVEGTLSNQDTILVPLEDLSTDKWEGWKLRADSSQYRVLENETEQKALIITRFELETASKANGFLHFELRDEEFVQEHASDVWVTISLVDLN
jgi:hypothetical protein